jgi:hypothetical protein
MYGLPQVGILTNELLKRNLARDGYRPTQPTRTMDPRHAPHIILVSSGWFRGKKCFGREHAEHLMACIKRNYSISSDWNGTAYCGLTLEWD